MSFTLSLLRYALLAPALVRGDGASGRALEPRHEPERLGPDRARIEQARIEQARIDRAMRLETIVERHLDTAWRTARDLGVPPHEVEDVVQEVLVVIVRRLDDIEVARERAFVAATTARVVANWRRTRRRRPEDLTESMDVIDAGALFERPGVRTPEQSLERSQKLAVLRQALDEMPEAQRIAFTLFELEQLTAREIAEQLGIAESAVFSRVRRAWVVFRRCCERHAGEGASGCEPTRARAGGSRDD